MSVESHAVAWDEPDELPCREDDLSADPDGLEEEVESSESSFDVCWLSREGGMRWLLEVETGDEEPDDRSSSEEDWSDEEGHVVSESRDQSECGAEGTRCSCDFVKDVNHGVHASELLHIASNDISGDYTANKSAVNQRSHDIHSGSRISCTWTHLTSGSMWGKGNSTYSTIP